MKKTAASNLWQQLMKRLKDAPNISTNIDLFNEMIDWIKEHEKYIGTPILKDESFFELLELEPSRYILRAPERNIKNEIKRLQKNIPSSIKIMTMILLDYLWEMVTIVSDLDCPSCTYFDVRFYVVKDAPEHGLVQCCHLCYWKKASLAAPADHSVKLIPATLEEVDRRQNMS